MKTILIKALGKRPAPDYSAALTFRFMIVSLAIFTLSDILITMFGLRVGCQELNSFVLAMGLGSWGIFRVVLLAYLAIVFLAAYRYCRKHLIYRGKSLLMVALLTLNIYVGVSVALGLFAILSRI